MARSLRKRFAGAKYHVTNRGNGRDRIFFTEDDCQRFHDQLVDAMDADNVILYAYCLMPNHFHLFVETPDANIDRFMGRLQTAYAMYFRYKHYRPGHCFQGRYGSPLVSGDDYILRLTRYIHLNPVKVAAAQGWSVDEKWSRLLAHRWNSFHGYVRSVAREEHIDYRWLEMFVGSCPTLARRRYGRYMRQMLGADDEVLLEAMDASSYAIGNEPFRKEVEDWVRREARKRPRSGDVAVPGVAAVSLEVIEKAVTDELGVDPALLREPRRRLGGARGLVVELGCRLGQQTQRRMADHLGGLSEHAVSKSRQALRDRMAQDPAFQRKAVRIERAILRAKL